MCRFKSGIITYNHRKVLHDNFINNHTTILKNNNIKDDCKESKFVRVEIIPKDYDIYNQDKNNWELIVDQDYIPCWFDKELAYKQMWKALNKNWKEAFIINQDLDEIVSRQLYAIKNSRIITIGNSCVKILEDSEIQDIANSIINYCNNSSINGIYSSTINEVAHSSRIRNMIDNSVIFKISSGSSVDFMYQSSCIHYAPSLPYIPQIYNDSIILHAHDRKRIISDITTVKTVKRSDIRLSSIFRRILKFVSITKVL